MSSKEAPKVAVIAGYGPGNGQAILNRFAKDGYHFALLSRNKDKLQDAVAALEKKAVPAKGFSVDLSDQKEVSSTFTKIRKEYGSIHLLIWNPGVPSGEGSVLQGDPAKFESIFATMVSSLVAAIQVSLEDLKANKGSVLVTGGGMALDNDFITQYAANSSGACLASPKAAQRKLVAVAHHELKPHGVYVGELTICGIVKGTSYDPEGKSDLTTEAVADALYELNVRRSEVFDVIPKPKKA